MKHCRSIVFVLHGFVSLLQGSDDQRINHLFHRLEDCRVLQRAETLRALADHPVLEMFLTNIREEKPETSAPLSQNYIDDFIAASQRVKEYTHKLDQALNNSDMLQLERLLSSASASQSMDYDERKLLWIMMDAAMITRLRGVQEHSIQSKLADIFKCPAIALFSAESQTLQ